MIYISCSKNGLQPYFHFPLFSFPPDPPRPDADDNAFPQPYRKNQRRGDCVDDSPTNSRQHDLSIIADDQPVRAISPGSAWQELTPTVVGNMDRFGEYKSLRRHKSTDSGVIAGDWGRGAPGSVGGGGGGPEARTGAAGRGMEEGSPHDGRETGSGAGHHGPAEGLPRRPGSFRDVKSISPVSELSPPPGRWNCEDSHDNASARSSGADARGGGGRGDSEAGTPQRYGDDGNPRASNANAIPTGSGIRRNTCSDVARAVTTAGEKGKTFGGGARHMRRDSAGIAAADREVDEAGGMRGPGMVPASTHPPFPSSAAAAAAALGATSDSATSVRNTGSHLRIIVEQALHGGAGSENGTVTPGSTPGM